jgi:hypothetical protein
MPDVNQDMLDLLKEIYDRIVDYDTLPRAEYAAKLSEVIKKAEGKYEIPNRTSKQDSQRPRSRQ